MDIQAFVYLIHTVAEQQTWLLPFVVLTCKTSLLIIIAILLTASLRRSSASTRHLVWFALVFALLFFPLFLKWIPDFDITVSENLTYFFEKQTDFNQGTGNQFLLSKIMGLSFPVYVFVVLAGLMSIVAGIIRIAVITRQSVMLNGSSAEKILNQILEDEGLELSISIRSSNAIKSPVSWGFINHFILLPESANNWTEDRLNNVIAHELSHIERFDWLSLILGRVVLAMYWFNPLVWFSLKKMNEEAELACDDAVVLEQDNAEYAQTLVLLAKDAQRHSKVVLLVKSIASSFLGKRVNAILNGNAVRIRTESLFLVRALLVGFPIVSLVAGFNLVPPDTQASGFSYSQNLYAVEYIREIPDSAGLRDHYYEYYEKELSPPSREMFDSLPGIPVIETVVSRNEIEKYLQSYSANDAGDYPQVSLEEINISSKGFGRREILRRSSPIYPENAKRQGIEGYAVVEYELSTGGRVVNPRVIESIPNSVFDRSALKALEEYRFTPQPVRLEQNNSMLNARLKTRFVFQLQPEPG